MARKTIETNIAYDDKKKTYYVNFDYGKDESGTRIKRAGTFGKLSDAKKALKEHEANKTKGTLVIPKETTLEEWVAYYIDDVLTPKSSPTTISGYRYFINNHIIPALGKTLLQQLSASQIQRYYASLSKEKKLKQTTIRKHHDFLNSALKLAVKQDIILKNPLEKVDAPKPEDHETNYYTPEQLMKLIELVKGDRLEIVVYLAGLMGLRREEIDGLKWDKVDFENRLIHIKEVRTASGKEIVVKEPKSKSSKRSLFIPDDVLEVLQKERDKQNEYKVYLGEAYNDVNYVVATNDGNPYRPNYLSYLFTELIKKNNLPPITLHGLRHSFATAANAQNIPLYNIGKLLGHSTTVITDKIYTHLVDNTHENALTKVADSIIKKDK